MERTLLLWEDVLILSSCKEGRSNYCTMGKRGDGRRRRKQQAARSEAQFSERSRQAYINDRLVYEENKRAQSEYLNRVAEIEKDILSRTVYFFQAKNLRKDENFRALRSFVERNYGHVQEFVLFNDRKKRTHDYPGARVRFQFKRDAEDFFGGTELLRVSSPFKEFFCPVGHRGKIRVKPCPPYADMAKDELEGSVIKFTASALCLGHWFPSGEDVYSTWNDEAVGEDCNEWFGELDTGITCTVSIDLNNRIVELEESGIEGLSRLALLRARFQGDMASINRYFATFRFKELVKHIDICVDPENPNVYALLISLKHSPKLELEDLLDEKSSERVRSVSFGSVESDMFGECHSLKLSVSKTELDRVFLNERGLERLQNFGVFRTGIYSVSQSSSFKCMHIGTRGKATLEDELKIIGDRKTGLLLRSVLNHGMFCWYHAVEDKIECKEGGHLTIFDLIRRSCSPCVVAQALNRMLEAHGKTKYPCRLFQKLAPRNAGPLPERPIPGHCFSIPRLHITPSRQLLVGFEVEMSNRVIRRFVEEANFYPESFLRVQICDEDGQKLFYNDLSDLVVSRIMTTILSGVVLNGRRYSFLAYSSSQLKDCSLWMVCPEGDWTVRRMRESLGNFSVCQTASKYAARIGQCFSTTVQGLVGERVLTPLLSAEATLPLLHVEDIISIHVGREMRHSDGSGLIRREAMSNLVKRLPFGPGRPEDVSIIQIRCGGAKGTLTAWDFDELEKGLFPSSLAGFDICLRPSMIKFEASYKSVEVCSVGTHVPYYLNRNVVLLLRFHGIRDETFVGMQREVLKDLDTFLVDPEKAQQMLPQIGGPDGPQKSLLLDMIMSGITPAKDPFLYSCFHAIRSHHIYGLRKKARIFIEKGAVLMGGIDETGIVPEGCVFVQVRKSLLGDHASTKSGFEPIVGPVMVTKHPVMHPGDVRMLLAVDVLELRRHNNVILFSRKGSRPEADKMAGSDLDGDEFAVTWDPRLFINDNSDPFDYDCSNTVEPSPEAFPSDDDERSIALMNHFINHAKSDNLGQISMMWQDYAASKGAGCDECIELAALHSVAVDFPKTGVPAKIPRDLIIPRIKPRAHWREKKATQSYHCTSVIGKLYDEATGQIDTEVRNAAEIAIAGRKKDKFGQLISTTEGEWVGDYLKKIYDPYIPHQLGFLIDDEWLQRFANEQRFSYDQKVVTMMNRYKISSEGELFTGCIRKFHKYHKKRQHEVSEAVRRECRELRKEHRSNFFRQVLKIATSSLEAASNASRAVASASHHDAEFDTPTLIENDLEPTGTHSFGEGSSQDTRESIAGVAVDEEEESEVNQDEDEEDSEDEDEEVGTERLELVEQIATDASLAPEGSRDSLIRKTAHRLAAAYYMSAYSPDLRWRQKGSTGSSLALFSFPWIIADVIACGLQETP